MNARCVGHMVCALALLTLSSSCTNVIGLDGDYFEDSPRKCTERDQPARGTIVAIAGEKPDGGTIAAIAREKPDGSTIIAIAGERPDGGTGGALATGSSVGSGGAANNATDDDVNCASGELDPEPER